MFILKDYELWIILGVSVSGCIVILYEIHVVDKLSMYVCGYAMNNAGLMIDSLLPPHTR